jgi:hypothetical protein
LRAACSRDHAVSFHNWFDPIEGALRERVRGCTEADGQKMLLAVRVCYVSNGRDAPSAILFNRKAASIRM